MSKLAGGAGSLFGGGNRNAAGTGPAFGGGVGAPDSVVNLPAGSFAPQAGMMDPSKIVSGPSKWDQMRTALNSPRGKMALGAFSGGLNAARGAQQQPAAPASPYVAPMMPYIQPPPPMGGGFYGE